MSFYGDTIHLRFLFFSFDQMSRTLGDLRVHGACGERDRKWRRSPGGSLIWHSGKSDTGIQVRSRNLPAPQTQRASQQRTFRHMVGSGKKPWQVAIPHQQPPHDGSLPTGVRVPRHVRLKHFRGSGRLGEPVKTPL